MATRSTIGRLNPDGTVTSIYCHFDGYPDYMLPVLTTKYTDPATVDALLALGDLSILGSVIGERIDFKARPRPNDQCLAYGRDRGEQGVEAITFANAAAWRRERSGQCCEYAYLWAGGRWQVYDRSYMRLGEPAVTVPV